MKFIMLDGNGCIVISSTPKTNTVNAIKYKKKK